ncbi:glycosyltransferase family 1 protein [Haloparvum alkalitolerans]|uniref:glycosyltransferase family 4 protein n=1 Tax=Haloparvum alkalitolerans TaxID=1042953 RepID=UPI003CF6C42B
MKVGVAYNYDPCELRTGGGITYCNNLVRSLTKKGHKVELFDVELTTKREPIENLSHHPVQHSSDNWWRFIFNLYRKIDTGDLEDLDVIHTHHPLVMLPFLLKQTKTPTVCTFHGVPLDWLDANYPMVSRTASVPYKKLEREIIQRVDKTTTAGPEPQKRLSERHGDWFEVKNKPIPSGVDLDFFSPEKTDDAEVTEGVTTYLFAGRLSKQKNLKSLFHAFNIVSRNNPQTELIVLGRGEMRDELENYVTNPNVRFKGEVPFEQVPQYMAAADVFCLPSLYEASPTVVKETLSCGTPIVSTDVGDVSEIITAEELGEIVLDDDAETIAAAMEAVARRVEEDPENIRRACRNYAAKNFAFDTIAEAYIRTFESAMAR